MGLRLGASSVYPAFSAADFQKGFRNEFSEIIEMLYKIIS
jgi:hypothetical protein